MPLQETPEAFVVNVYVPNSGEGLKRLDYRIKHWVRRESSACASGKLLSSSMIASFAAAACVCGSDDTAHAHTRAQDTSFSNYIKGLAARGHLHTHNHTH